MGSTVNGKDKEGRSHAALARLARIRDVLLGAHQRETAGRFELLESQLNERVAADRAARADGDRRLGVLERLVRGELEKISQRLDAERSARSTELGALKQRLKVVAERLDAERSARSTELGGLKQRLEAVAERYETHVRELLDRSQTEQQAIRAELLTESKTWRDEQEKLQVASEQAITALRTEHEAALKAVRTALDQRLQAARGESERALGRVRAEYDKAFEKVRADKVDQASMANVFAEFAEKLGRARS